MANIRKKLKLYLIAGITLILLIGLTGCISDIDKKYNGLSIGFNYENPNSLRSIVCAARSEKIEFDIKNVELDFFYGWQKEPPYIIEQSDDNLMEYALGFVLYIMNPKDAYNIDEQGNSYRDESKIVFLKKFDAVEFVSSSYNVTITKREGKQYQQSERFAVPKDLFINPSGELWFTIAYETNFNIEGTRYGFCRAKDYMRIKYECINENTVKLSK